MLAVIDPVSFDEAQQHEEWRTAMMEEIQAIEKNKTWKLSELPPEKN